MAITPINGMSFGNRYNSVTPTPKDNDQVSQPISKANKMVSIPVALWMAISPQISSAQEILPSPKVDEAEYTPAMQKNYMSGVEVVKEKPYYLQEEYIKREEPFQIDGKNYTMYYQDMGANEFENERVGGVYIVPEDFELVRKNGMELNSPMQVVEVVFHRTEDASKNFVSVVTIENTCDKDGTNEQKIVREMRVPDEIGDELIDFEFGYSGYFLANPESIGFRTVNSDKLMNEYVAPTKVLELDDIE